MNVYVATKQGIKISSGRKLRKGLSITKFNGSWTIIDNASGLYLVKGLDKCIDCENWILNNNNYERWKDILYKNNVKYQEWCKKISIILKEKN